MVSGTPHRSGAAAHRKGAAVKSAPNAPIGKAIVVGGGIGGIQCALDLADTGFYVYLLEKSHSLGGTMARLDKTFPTNDCSTCMFSPKLVQASGHVNIEIITGCELLALDGEPGHFSARVRIEPRYIDAEKCITCGQCAQKCPQKVPDLFNGGLSVRKAAFLPFPQAVPLKYALDAEHCLYLTQEKCGVCKKICPTQAVAYDQLPETTTLKAGAVVLSTGFETALTAEQGEFGYGRYDNVVTSLQYERILSATGPYDGHIRRPSDGKVPKKVAWIQCVMSRDAARNRPFCSSVCCMHAAKQAVMTRDHEPQTEAVIYFMDIRAHGKGFDDYVDRARNQHQVHYRRSMISQVYLNPQNDNLIIETFDHHLNHKMEEEYDMVVLSSGFKPSAGFSNLAAQLGVVTNAYGFLGTEFDTPVSTSRPGVFVCGGVEAPKDIPETVIQAGAAAAEASIVLSPARDTETVVEKSPSEAPLEDEPRVGVFVCHCGTNIAGVVQIDPVVEYVKTLPHVAFATDFMFSCTTETQKTLVDLIRQHRLNRVVVAACSPRTHEPLFQDTLREAGLNPYLFELASIRDQCSWVHAKEPEKATEKSKDIIRASVARAVLLEPLRESTYPVVNQGLVIGGGVAGMTAALAMADQGYAVHLLEQSDRLGGFTVNLTATLEGHSPVRLVRYLTERIQRHPNVSLHLDSRLIAHSGQTGAFEGTLESRGQQQDIRYGGVVVATGGRPYEPDEYLFGSDPRVLTQVAFSKRMAEDPVWAGGIKRVVMIQCVGSRREGFSFCSRVCCSAAVKNSIQLKEINPKAQIVVLYRDVRTFGFKELYYLKARKKGVLFFRYIPEEKPEVFDDGGKLTVDFMDRGSHQDFRVEPDLVVLSAGIRPGAGAAEVADLLKLPRSEEGFFLEAHVKLRPLDFASAGIFLAGLAHSPRFIEETITMAKGAAQQVLKILSKKEMVTSPAVAEVDADKCSACLICVRQCPFNAPFINARGVSEIPPSACQGCGLCAAECPARAITLKHTTDAQVTSKIDALLASALV
ncbi:MAG: CoB--CoM heterodisulfide reductase iron-sulfur subunit A family protein [Deltaproteobacteria bacterium]|nr:CoB--CoM heterodisulfide reductase iron-sulfur subunit A family protein [Deltaproteobacteria bacterium]